MYPTLHPSSVSQELLNHVARTSFSVDPILLCYAVGLSIAAIVWMFGVLIHSKLGTADYRTTNGTPGVVSVRRAGLRGQTRVSTHG